MKNRKGLSRLWLRLAFAQLFGSVARLSVHQAAQAQWVARGSTIPAGQEVGDDMLLTGTDIGVCMLLR